MGCINISVYCIWIPAQLQVSQTYININFIWDRVGKVIFAVVDVALNVYFIKLVRSKLIANGLTKYNRLFYFNVGMICISLALDIILIGTMSIGAGVLYIQVCLTITFDRILFFIMLTSTPSSTLSSTSSSSTLKCHSPTSSPRLFAARPALTQASTTTHLPAVAVVVLVPQERTATPTPREACACRLLSREIATVMATSTPTSSLTPRASSARSRLVSCTSTARTRIMRAGRARLRSCRRSLVLFRLLAWGV